MDRRDFFKTFLITPFLSPFLFRFKPADQTSRLYLITDTPQFYLPILLQELYKTGLMFGRRFSLHNSFLFDNELSDSLVQKGWKFVPPSSRADFSLSFDRLHRRAFPSFTLVKEGRILDVRTKNLGSLWMHMNRNRLFSSLLTVVSFTEKPSLYKGKFISVYQNGHKIDTLSLDNTVLKPYITAKGPIMVRIKDCRAEVIESSCPQRICCFSPPISLAGERIICAPNHFLLEVESTPLVDTAIG